MKCLGRYLVVASIAILTITLIPLCYVGWMREMTVYAKALVEYFETKSTSTRPRTVEFPNSRVYPNSWELASPGFVKAASDSTSSHPSLNAELPVVRHNKAKHLRKKRMMKKTLKPFTNKVPTNTTSTNTTQMTPTLLHRDDNSTHLNPTQKSIAGQ